VSQVRFLKALLASSPEPDVVWDPREIIKSVEELGAESQSRSGPALLAPALLARIFERSQDLDVRAACLRALLELNNAEARNQLDRLSPAGVTEARPNPGVVYLSGEAKAADGTR
jgi:hypothetical protein